MKSPFLLLTVGPTVVDAYRSISHYCGLQHSCYYAGVQCADWQTTMLALAGICVVCCVACCVAGVVVLCNSRGGVYARGVSLHCGVILCVFTHLSFHKFARPIFQGRVATLAIIAWALVWGTINCTCTIVGVINFL